MSDDPHAERDPLRLLPDFHRSTRMPLDAVVRLHFEGTVAYQNGFAANVSALGMFVKHPEPPEVGTQLVFEFVLGDERKPVQGGGVVTWVRERYEGPGRPAGVGIQFTELDSLSRQHIAEGLFEYLETQLGVEVADHPDVPDLLAAMPQSTVIDVATEEESEPPAAAEAQGAIRFEPPADWTSRESGEAAPEPAEEPEPFRLFGNGEELAGDPRMDDLDAPREEIFSPVTPPEPIDLNASVYGAARRREPPGWLPFAIAFGIAAAGFAGWWFLWGPGAEARQRQEPPAVVAEQPAPSPARPRLDPQPGPGTTLVEAVAAPDAVETASTEPAAEAPAPPPTSEPRADPTPAPAVTAAAGASPAAAVADTVTVTATPARAATRVTDIRWSAADGGTDVTLTGDGAFVAGNYRWFEMRDDRPRVLVRLTGMAAGYPRATLDVGTLELAGIRLGFHQKPTGNELHVVLDLAARDVQVAGVEPAGDRLVIRLRHP